MHTCGSPVSGHEVDVLTMFRQARAIRFLFGRFNNISDQMIAFGTGPWIPLVRLLSALEIQPRDLAEVLQGYHVSLVPTQSCSQGEVRSFDDVGQFPGARLAFRAFASLLRKQIDVYDVGLREGETLYLYSADSWGAATVRYPQSPTA